MACPSPLMIPRGPAAERGRSAAEGFAMDFLTAWRTHGEWRDRFLASATRELSKHGDLDSHAHVYRELAAGLTPAEAVSLYQQLRQSRRPEFEWRDQFLALFPQVGPADLPLAPARELR